MSGRELPKGWEETTIGEISPYIQRGKSPKYCKESELPVVNQKSIRWNGIDVRHLKFVAPDQWEQWGAERFLRGGDILWNSTGTGTIGRAALFEDARPYERMVADSHVTVVRVSDDCNRKYVKYFIQSPEVQSKIKSMQSGSTNQVELNLSEVVATSIPLAPSGEQHRIVEKIEALTARSRRAKEALDAIPALLDRYRQSVLAAAFRGDLTADWRTGHPEAEAAEAFLDRIGVPIDAIDVTELPLHLPNTWRWARLSDIAEVKGGLAKGKKRNGGATLELVPYLRVANVQRGHLDLSEMKEIEATASEIDQLLLRPGDILFNEGGDRDKLGRGWVWSGEIERCIHQNHVFRARPRSPQIDPFLISHFGNTFGQRYFFGEGKQSVNLASISMAKLKAFPVPVIPPTEQVVLRDRIHDAFRRSEILEAAWVSASEKLPLLDQSILAKAFRGELVPQDPNDEPALVLLERIRRERAVAGTTPKRGRRPKT